MNSIVKVEMSAHLYDPLERSVVCKPQFLPQASLCPKAFMGGSRFEGTVTTIIILTMLVVTDKLPSSICALPE